MKIRLLAIAALAVLFTGAIAQGPKASAEEMIADITSFKLPAVDQTKLKDEAYVHQYLKDRKVALRERAKLILSFYKEYPTHEQALPFMSQRWAAIVDPENPAKEDLANATLELDEVIKTSANEKLTEAAYYWKSNYGVMSATTLDAKLAAIDQFTGKYPASTQGVRLLTSVADSANDKDGKLRVYERIVRDYKDAPGAKYAPGKIRQIKNLGQPFEMSFTDAITGKNVSISDYKGKVVVIDFWATWCGPCIADLPKVQKMYADLKDQGVEIISVSLDYPEDKGGLKSLKDFVAKNPMPWAHYYQGKHWDGDFSVAWGINSIPALFLVDQNGILVDVQARANLEDRIKALLAKNK